MFIRMPRDGFEKTWLAEQPDTRLPWGLGCLLCCKAGLGNRYAQFTGSAKNFNLLRHGNHLPQQQSGDIPKTHDHEHALRELDSLNVATNINAGDCVPEDSPITMNQLIFVRTMLQEASSFDGVQEMGGICTSIGCTRFGSM